ncbi:MAG: MiaB/RimO family radical SAM methylthiotransferase [Phycisphaerales bacterium]|nr:MiaB/RimO family radical SAM methylthiotransferase [Phycisphaerae bacterium]NNF43787.1 MiaB/RimO family radical SAM methylthiotransferase [Phycisphaerales bacterium]NNM26877.1 MiaB/RimO family radical SAM methylthiotransferase [Phycisphaerales bacterium]
MITPTPTPPPSPTPGLLVHLETFGCQMNELDSELVRGQLQALGYRFTDDAESADVLLLNTCSVREQAENKALSRVGLAGVAKREGRELIVGLIGCLAEREGARLLSRYPQIDLLCGPGELDRLPLLLDNAVKSGVVERHDRYALQGNRTRRSRTLAAAEDNLELLDLSRVFDPDRGPAGGRTAYVRITRGCNKFCTYCVVPNTRGPEVHRPPEAIVEECRRLADAGVIEVTLLGQTVNHYVYTHGAAVTVDGRPAPQVGPGAAAFRDRNGPRGARTTSFADLLHLIHEAAPEIRRVRFVTSFPRDFGDDILQVMADSPRICRYLHVPAQSGSDTVLKRMNRGYTRGVYLEFIERARAILPDVCIAGDIIVGFCGEREEEYEETRTLMEAVRFKNNFIFKYSPRPGTAAFERLPDDVPEAVKRRRNNELLALQAEISASVHAEWVGRTVDVFVEQVSGHRSARPAGGVELGWDPPVARTQLSGRTGGDLIAVFDAPPGVSPEELVGRIVPVEVRSSGPLILRGDLAPAPAGMG